MKKKNHNYINFILSEFMSKYPQGAQNNIKIVNSCRVVETKDCMLTSKQNCRLF